MPGLLSKTGVAFHDGSNNYYTGHHGNDSFNRNHGNESNAIHHCYGNKSSNSNNTIIAVIKTLVRKEGDSVTQNGSHHISYISAPCSLHPSTATPHLGL